ncbi:MAG TPA: HepT-like ribonuclease domain-containing protein [Iamia sp.]|nr:HepT-like ribonuclease domain-containing protein [Iamia sp.]
MADAVATALRFVDGRDRAALDDDEMLVLALTKLVEIVGEAAKQVTSETREQYPAVPWSAAARMPDRLIHHYFDIDLDVLWSTVETDLPGLIAILPRAIEEDSP